MSQSYTGSRRYTGPIVKKARYLNFPSLLEGRISKSTKGFGEVSVDKNKKRRRGRKSSFAEENEQIQKICYLYGLKKGQLRNSFLKTKNKEGIKEDNLYLDLELRADNIVFRAGFGTRRFARQIVSHEHVTLNGKKINVPSHKLKVGDCIELTEKIYKSPVLKSFVERKQIAPLFLEVENRKITLKRTPLQEEISKKEINASLVIRRYSREV